MSTDRRGIRYALVGLLVGVLVLLFLYRIAQTATLAGEIRDAQVTNGHTLNTSAETLRVIKDCTQPSGECFQRSQKRTGDAVASINNVVILAAACSAGLPRDLTVSQRQTRIQQCVIARLAAHAR